MALHLRRQLAAAVRQGQPHRRARRSSGGADRLQGCRGLRAMGRQGAADRSRVGVRRARRARRTPSSPGATSSRPAASTWPTPGRATSRSRTMQADGYARTSPVRAFPANGYGVLRHDRQRLGMDGRLVFGRSTRPTRRRPAAFPRTRAARRWRAATTRASQRSDSAQGAEGRLASLRAQLLPTLSSGGAPCRAGRHLDQPCRVSLCRQEGAIMSDKSRT